MRYLYFFPLIVVLCLATTGCGQAKIDELTAKVESLEAENKSLMAEKDQLHVQLGKLQSELSATEKKLAQSELAIEKAKTAAMEKVQQLLGGKGLSGADGLLKNVEGILKAGEGLPEFKDLKSIDDLLKAQSEGATEKGGTDANK